jgi:transposase InsO family protein
MRGWANLQYRSGPFHSIEISPQTNGIVERFHRTVLNEFYKVAFRRKIYAGIEQLQADLDNWIAEYNEVRPHQGRWCYGKTPRQTFADSLPLAREKILSRAVAAGAADELVS